MRVLCGVLILLLASCSLASRDPVVIPGTQTGSVVVLDLTDQTILAKGPVMPGLWAWDANILWQPRGEGRPTALLPAVALPGPETGGTLVHDLVRPFRPNEHGGLVSATASLQVLVPSERAVWLRIGAFPGAQRVWVNGVVVLERGVLSLDPRQYRSEGAGDEVQVQPLGGRLEIVVNLVSNTALVKHRELNRFWSIAAVEARATTQSHERVFRAFQMAVLGLVSVVFLLIGTQFRRSSGLIEFGVFLLVCLLKLMFNVEESRTLLSLLGLEVDVTVLLFVNHGLNLVPFVLFLWFLNRRFPLQVSVPLVLQAAAVCLALEVWELSPFVALAWGWSGSYEAFMRAGWSLVLNISVVVSVLLIFERLFQIDRARLPLGRVLFGSGILLGLIIMVPVILSLFVFVPFSLYLGAGLFVFLVLISWELIRLELVGARNVREGLILRTTELESLAHFFPEHWAPRLGRARVEDVRPGDQRLTEAVFLQVTCAASWESWLPGVQRLASKRQAIFIAAQGGTATWMLDSRPENALALALEVQADCRNKIAEALTLVAAKSVVELSVLEASGLWIPRFEPIPTARLQALSLLASNCGAVIVLDVALKDGLVVGGWRKHRLLSPDGQSIELFEGSLGAELASKLTLVTQFEQALGYAADAKFAEAIATLVEILRVNPLDQAARYYLALWQTAVPRPR